MLVATDAAKTFTAIVETHLVSAEDELALATIQDSFAITNFP
jgi:hypothetical protein